MTISLILNNGQPVPRRRAGKLENLPPSVAIVYPVEHGPWVTESRQDRSPAQRFLHANKDCYVVDLSDHRRTGRLSNTPLTCSDGGHRFEATFDVGFRVHDPVQVVRGNVKDALTVVYGYLTARMRVYAAQFAIDRAADAQDHMNRAFATAMPLPEGITIYHCTVLIEPDAAARVFVQQLLEAERERVLGQEAHRTAEGRTHSGERLKDIQHEARIQREQQERRVLAGLQLDFRGMILEHLAKHPADTEQAMNLLMRLEESKVGRAEIREERHVEMVKYLIEKGVVREIDLPGLRQGALGGAAGMDPLAAPLPLPQQLSGPAGGGPGTGPGPAGPQVTAPVRWGGSGGSQTPQSPPATGLMPVYVVLDVSPGAAGCRIELANALRSLQTALVNSPDVASAIRVSVLTYAEGAEVLMPLVELTWGTSVPELVSGTACRHRPVFQRLLELLPLDLERLKEQVPRVLRPVVFFLTAQPAEDGGDWPAVHAELMRHHYHPHLVVCGIGAAARPALTTRLASLPELGVVAVPGSDLSESAVRFSVLLQNTVLHLGRSALAGRMELHLECPEGLTPGTTFP
ncbi:hypothetical protein OG230_14710 [Streptomyces sp. NBC_00234]|uniref:hypothetical protein n=1 Tax=Streptomyces sp. NBC_00234 TaxID=2903638 RepID=UPI002E2A0545|nr:hypothetical protein [Streptomyces sp. NBC_00234]